jgi:hypothetical protein
MSKISWIFLQDRDNSLPKKTLFMRYMAKKTVFYEVYGGWSNWGLKGLGFKSQVVRVQSKCVVCTKCTCTSVITLTWPKFCPRITPDSSVLDSLLNNPLRKWRLPIMTKSVWGCDKEKTVAYIKRAFKQCHNKVASSKVPPGFRDWASQK